MKSRGEEVQSLEERRGMGEEGQGCGGRRGKGEEVRKVEEKGGWVLIFIGEQFLFPRVSWGILMSLCHRDLEVGEGICRVKLVLHMLIPVPPLSLKGLPGPQKNTETELSGGPRMEYAIHSRELASVRSWVRFPTVQKPNNQPERAGQEEG